MGRGLDLVPFAECATSSGGFDARNYPRSGADVGAACDAGAYERTVCNGVVQNDDFTVCPVIPPSAAPVPQTQTQTATNVSNDFSFGKTVKNKKKGTATLTVNVPGPGQLALSGKGVKNAAATQGAAGPGSVKLTVRASGKKKQKLSATGKVKLTAGVTYSPLGGQPRTRSVPVKLIKKT